VAGECAWPHDGHLSLSRAPLEPLPLGPDGQPAPVRLLLAPEPLPAQRPLATLKTSQRAHYDAAVRAATAQGAFDSLLFSPEGWLLEGGRSNVLARLDGRWCTPRVADGVLPGVMRSVLMDDPHWALQERRLHRDECGQVQAWAVCNALRGVVAVSQVLGLTGDMTP
jgi:para-aminobenzoate synthetase/4-amino-4-deoxychorismate lyase